MVTFDSPAGSSAILDAQKYVLEMPKGKALFIISVEVERKRSTVCFLQRQSGSRSLAYNSKQQLSLKSGLE